MKNSDYQSITNFLDALSTLADEVANDDTAKANLGSNPHGELSARGFDIPEGVDINVVSDSTDTVYLVLPPDPNVSLTDDALGTVAGGFGDDGPWNYPSSVRGSLSTAG